MLLRYVVLFILSIVVLSGCASVPPTTGSESPSQSPPVQEEASPWQQPDVASKSKTDSESEMEAGSRSNENALPKVSVEEAAPEDNKLQRPSPTVDVESLLDVV